MKLYCTTLLLWIQMTLCPAGHTAPGAADTGRYKQLSGWYGRNDGICLFDDGKFLLYGYATAVFGRYVLDKERILFYPERPDHFEVYATRNKDIGDSTRINFRNFDRGPKVFAQFDQGMPQQVFNDDANCFDPPFVYVRPRTLSAFTLLMAPDLAEVDSAGFENAWIYRNTGYNDFIWICNGPRREQQDFAGILRQSGEQQDLVLSNYGGEKGFRKRAMDEEDGKEWQEVLEMKTQYYREKEQLGLGLLANKHYKLFLSDIVDYYFDQASNQYIRKQADGGQDSYDDDRRLRKYVKLGPQAKHSLPVPVAATKAPSLFFTTCGDGAERSYHYPMPEPAGMTTDPPLQTTRPAPPMPVNGNNAYSEKEYTQCDFVIKERYRDTQLVWQERWNTGKSTATIKHFKAGKPVFRVEIANRYSLVDEIISVYDNKGKLLERKVASEHDGTIEFRVYDPKGRFIRGESSAEVQDWLKDPEVSAGHSR